VARIIEAADVAIPEEDMQSWQVSDKLEKVQNNWAELIEPILEDTSRSEKRAKRAQLLKELPQRGLFD
jgi:hypothetical protein